MKKMILAACLGLLLCGGMAGQSEAEVDIGGISRRISLRLTPEARVGDYALLHTGYAINIIDREQAEETLKLLEEIAGFAEEEE